VRLSYYNRGDGGGMREYEREGGRKGGDYNHQNGGMGVTAFLDIM